MKAYRNNSFFSTIVYPSDIAKFNSTFPCSDIPEETIRFEWHIDGDLVDIESNSDIEDDAALAALILDAKDFALKELALPCNL